LPVFAGAQEFPSQGRCDALEKVEVLEIALQHFNLVGPGPDGVLEADADVNT
jgi:hypothetical protein